MKDFEYKEFTSIRDVFTLLQPHRLRGMFRKAESVEIARLALSRSFRTERAAIAAVHRYMNSDEPEVEPPHCDCPEPNGLRWHKVDQGMPVTWAYNGAGANFANARPIIQGALMRIEELCGIKFKETADRNVDILIGWAELDGRGGTLGVTFVPGTGERMAACGPLCGDILFDVAEKFVPGPYFMTVLEHELGHALGLPHSDSRSSLMYPQLISLRSWQDVDVLALRERYPLESIPA